MATGGFVGSKLCVCGDLMWYMCSVLLGVCGPRMGSGYKNSITQRAVVQDHRLLPGALRDRLDLWSLTQTPHHSVCVCA